jgi:asparagine synthase (glutamine-hydrolysing)
MLGAEQLEALPAIVRAMEQPVANSDVIGLWGLAERASQDVKAVLCGEGADELFGSYPHQQLLASLSACPTFAVRGVGQLVGATPRWLLNRFSRYRGAASDVRVRQRLRAALKHTTLAERYRGLVSLFSEEERSALLHPSAMMDRVEDRWHLTEALNDGSAPPLERLIRMKFAGWLPDYHLGRENRIAMAHGLEARYPYLDTDVVEAVVPLGIKHKMGWRPPREKRLLRQIASDLLPRAIAQRPKGPVRVPVTCFGSRFHEMAGDVLSTQALATGGVFAAEPVQELLKAAREGSFLAGRQVFALLMFEVWRREWKVTWS